MGEKGGNEMIETARLKQDLDAYKAMCRELVSAIDKEDCQAGIVMVDLLAARDKAAKMLDNERTVGK